MRVIKTRYIAATDKRTARIEARCRDGNRVLAYARPFDHALSVYRNHEAVAVELILEHLEAQHQQKWVGAPISKGGYVFVRIFDDASTRPTERRNDAMAGDLFQVTGESE